MFFHIKPNFPSRLLQVQRPFDHLGESFTLERIIELGLDAYAEQISEISGAASKELAIEEVCCRF